MNQKLWGIASLSLAASIWGGMYVVSKYVLAYIPPFTLMWLRYVIAFTCLFFILKRQKQPPSTLSSKKGWILLIAVGFIGYFISIAFQFIGTKLADAHTGAIITSTAPTFTLLFAAFILKEKLTIQKLTALVIATIGVMIVIGWESEMSEFFWGSLILVGAAITWALLSVLARIATKTMSSLFLTTNAVLVAIPLTTPFMIWEMTYSDSLILDVKLLLGILYLGVVSTAVAFFLWNKGMESMEASTGSLFLFFQPLVGSLFGWLLLKESLSSSFFIGGSLIVIAVIFTFLPLSSKKGFKSFNK
ncbi:DMT family transporter [Bacillus sp. 2205SS5-2]|uniref:DMT family transporter n=1 Tax=Bacillus sp. 2205SS5-2 TaxID=3109031 RepID=UPI0030044849